ncbi:dual specificity protein kinase YAK1 homolog isoform X2 [Physcomitrium patens]|uniref:Protein kinase domain-containing protein n=1 Tax=Physcomitrium patens TaxID=3218 RepID=A0A7I4C7P9_PHYPA|nr:dual specificity protein kinase YAK1 homolog isoform X2 [Physcomitrium patens]|eukprot:XP_024357303.1 dual specificity protein kinase YAK1 homolog isoform X2 [Physcomitrella patens]
MDLNQQKEPDPEERQFYPVPHSHWFPRPIAFRVYTSSGGKSQHDCGSKGARRLHIQVSRPLPVRLTKEIVDTYHACNPSFQYTESCNPKRFLTVPSVGVSNNGSDNENHDLILYFGRILANDDNTRRYVVKDLVGCGTFGQVAKCLILETNDLVAVKVIKNQRAYSTQARVEIGILHRLNNIRDRRNEHHVVRSFDHFSCEGHLCIVFELLGVNLFELLKTNNLKGISLQLVRIFTGQLLDALSLLHDARVIHCDLKPENILLSSLRTAEIKLIDFGSACMEDHTVYSYIQSRFYRSPEVVLGHPYSTAIDMWSLGCVAAELFLGLPLFPGQCAYDLLRFIIEKLGKQPPDHILQKAKNTNKYFKLISAAPHPESGHTSGNASVYQFLTPEENEAREKSKPAIGKRYISGTLEKMIMTYPMKSAQKEEVEREKFSRKVFVDFLKGLIEVDPFKRWTPYEASQHPFLTDGPFTGPFKPKKETISRVPTDSRVTIEHKVSSGHWIKAGLSPHVGKMSLSSQFNGSQQFQPLNMAGSPASFGSFGDNAALGSSFGSIGECGGPSMSLPSGLSGHAACSARSPDARRQHMQFMQNVKNTQLGMSPSASGIRPSQGASPSHQFHIPGPPFQASPGSQHISTPGSQYITSPGVLYPGSPGSTFQISPGSSFHGPASPSQSSPRYGPPSPAYAAREFNKRRTPGLAPGLSGSGAVPYDNFLLSRLHQNNAASNRDGGGDNFSHMQGGSHMSSQWRAGRASSNLGVFDQNQLNNMYLSETLGPPLFTSETTTEAGDDELAGSGDWDGDFREEQLFEHDPISESTEKTMPSEIGPSDGVMGCGGARLGPGPGCGPNAQDSFLRKGPLHGPFSGYERGQPSKHGSASSCSSRLGYKHHKQPSAHTNYGHSPQYSFTSGSHSGNSSGPPSRWHPSGESSSHSSPAGVLHFQQRQHHPHATYHSPDHQQPSGSPLQCSRKVSDVAKPPSNGLLPLPQMDARGFYVPVGSNEHLIGTGGTGYVRAGIIPNVCGLGPPPFFEVGGSTWSAQQSMFPPGQIYATDHLLPGRKTGPSLVAGLNKPPATGRGACRFPK